MARAVVAAGRWADVPHAAAHERSRGWAARVVAWLGSAWRVQARAAGLQRAVRGQPGASGATRRTVATAPRGRADAVERLSG